MKTTENIQNAVQKLTTVVNVLEAKTIHSKHKEDSIKKLNEVAFMLGELQSVLLDNSLTGIVYNELDTINKVDVNIKALHGLLKGLSYYDAVSFHNAVNALRHKARDYIVDVSNNKNKAIEESDTSIIGPNGSGKSALVIQNTTGPQLDIASDSELIREIEYRNIKLPRKFYRQPRESEHQPTEFNIDLTRARAIGLYKCIRTALGLNSDNIQITLDKNGTPVKMNLSDIAPVAEPSSEWGSEIADMLGYTSEGGVSALPKEVSDAIRNVLSAGVSLRREDLLTSELRPDGSPRLWSPLDDIFGSRRGMHGRRDKTGRSRY